jgi:hypothetical protein
MGELVPCLSFVTLLTTSDTVSTQKPFRQEVRSMPYCHEKLLFETSKVLGNNLLLIQLAIYKFDNAMSQNTGILLPLACY